MATGNKVVPALTGKENRKKRIKKISWNDKFIVRVAVMDKRYGEDTFNETGKVANAIERHGFMFKSKREVKQYPDGVDTVTFEVSCRGVQDVAILYACVYGP